MESASKDLPNLKICIDNTQEMSDAEQSNVDDEEEDEAEIELCEPDSSESDSGLNISVSIDNGSKSDKRPPPVQVSRRYENKAGDFVTGFDISSKEVLEKKEKRAKRFGIDPVSSKVANADMDALYESLGITQSQLEKNHRGIRLEAVHLRGVDNMSTKDVLAYFEGFAPGSVEWIDDLSCNVVWLDKMTAARAMITLSSDPNELQSDTESSNEEEGETNSPATDTDKTPDTKDETNDPKESKEEDVPMKEDDDELNLLSSSEEEDEDKDIRIRKKTSAPTGQDNTTHDKKDLGNSKPEQMGTEQTAADKECADSTDGGKSKSEKATKHHSHAKKELTLPPGKWRVGVPCGKSNQLFLRFATMADKKMPGAEKRSQYYRKYGNPNFGGMKGIISGSRKRRLRAQQWEKEVEEEVEILRELSPPHIPEETEFDRHLRAEKERIMKLKNLDKELELRSYVNKEDEEEDGEVEEDEDEVDVQLELAELLAPHRQKRSMRMYADDEEEEILSKRFKGSPAARPMDARSRIQNRKQEKCFQSKMDRAEDSDSSYVTEEDDVPPQIYGDLRSRLDSKRKNRLGLQKVSRLKVAVPQDEVDDDDDFW